MKRRQIIEKDPRFYKSLLTIAIPVILQIVITTGVNLVDNIMLGQLTESALSASTQANQFINLYVFAIMGISMGASVLTSRYWGAQNIPALKKVVSIAIWFSLGLSAAFTLADIFLPEQIMRLYFRQEERELIAEGVRYLRWSTATFVLMALSFTLTNTLRSIGHSHVPLIASACAFGINIGANYVFIFGKLGCPAMGVAGAALGTVVARIVESSVIVGSFLSNKQLRFRIRDLFTPFRDLVGEFLHTSIPVLLSDCLLGLGDNVLAIIMGRIGSGFVTANSITMVIQRVSTIVIMGLAFSGCFQTGQVLGKGEVQAARRQGNTYLLIGLVFGALASVIIRLISGTVISLYKITPETREIAMELMDALCIVVVFRSVNSILSKGVLRGGGDTRFLLAADMSTMWLVAVPLGALAGLTLKLPPFFTYLFLYSDQILKAFWCILRLRSGKWIKHVQGTADFGEIEEDEEEMR